MKYRNEKLKLHVHLNATIPAINDVDLSARPNRVSHVRNGEYLKADDKIARFINFVIISHFH